MIYVKRKQQNKIILLLTKQISQSTACVLASTVAYVGSTFECQI